MTHTLLPRPVTVLTACLLTAPTVLAQTVVTNDVPATNLPPIIVQASRTGLSSDKMPAQVQIIGADEIARSGCTSTAEVLEKRAGVYVRNLSANPVLSQISMRGFGENSFGRVLILVNGERLNNTDMSAPNLSRVPVSAISRIEVIRGSQTVLYGDYAEAGVINIITDDSTARPQTTVSASAGSYDTYSTHVGKSGAFDDGVTYRANADWEKSGGYRDNGDYEIWSANAAVRKAWDEDRHLSLSSFYSDSDYGLPGALTLQQYRDSPRMSKDTQNRAQLKSWGINVDGRSTAGADGYAEANLTASRRETHGNYASWGNTADYDTDSFSLSPRYIRDAPVGGHQNQLTLGTDLRYDASDVAVLPWSLPYQYDRFSLAGYAQDEFFLTEHISLVLGERVERFFNRISNKTGADSVCDTEDSTEAALLYRPTEGQKYFVRAARFYHAPFIDESVTWGIPNPDLKPESGLLFEVGSEVALANEWRATFSAYNMNIQDEIFCNPYGQNVNSPDDTSRQGVDASFRWSRERVASAGLTYAVTRSRFTEGAYDDNTVPLVPRQTLNLDGEVYVASGLALLSDVRLVSSQVQGGDFDNAWDRIAPYGVADFGVRYEPPFAKGLRLIAGVDNAFDKQYCDFVYWQGYYPAIGRTWKISASYTF